MARIRTLKPEFWTSEQIVACSRDARLFFIGMWTFSDDFGNIPAKSGELRRKIFPGEADLSDQSINELLGQLQVNKLIQIYEVEGLKYWHVTGWKHQKIDKPSQKYPKFDECSTSVRISSPEIARLIPADVDVSSLDVEGKGCSNTSEGDARGNQRNKGNGETRTPLSKNEIQQQLREFARRKAMP